MNKRKISIILATATIASMGTTLIPKNLGTTNGNEVLLARENTVNDSQGGNNDSSKDNLSSNTTGMDNSKNVQLHKTTDTNGKTSNKLVNNSNTRDSKTNLNVEVSKAAVTPLENNKITINNVWQQSLGVLSFNSSTNKIEFSKGWSVVNPYLHGEAFSISLYGSNGSLIKSVTLNGGMSPENTLSAAFNNLSFSYGDVIQINYKTSSNISISNFNNEKSYAVKKPISIGITKSGLKELGNNIKVNPVQYVLNSNKVNISGTTTANTTVSVNVDNKVYNTISNSNGAFNLNINAAEDINSSTNIMVYAAGQEIQYITPVLNSTVYGITKNNITLMGNWSGGNYKTDVIAFNPVTNKINISGSMGAYFGNFSGNAFKVALYSKNGALIKSETYGASDTAQNLYNDFNNLGFSYGDIIQVSCLGPVKTSISNFDGESNYVTTKATSLEITQKGLKNLGSDLKLNPVYYTLNSNKVDVSGTTTANTNISINIDNKVYSTKSNAKGAFNMNIEAPQNINAETTIGVFANGEQIQYTNPILNPNIYGITKNNVTLMGNWSGGSYKTDVIAFNPLTNKINISGSMGAYFGNFSGNAFKVALYSKSGSLIKTETYAGDVTAQNLYNDFNNLDFSYGDMIEVTPLGPVKTDISNFSGEKTYTTTKPILMEINQSGLKACTMNSVKVNPFSVLGDGNATSGTITGVTAKGNEGVTVTVGGKTFTGESNSKGVFSIKIADASGFTNTTNILVSATGELTTTINPTAITNLGIEKSTITVSGSDYDAKLAQKLSFNPATMTVANSDEGIGSNSFSAQLISGTTGKVLASCSTSNFNAFSSTNNLNGAKYQYGDIVAVYESKETELSFGKLSLNNGNTKTPINCVESFSCYEITPSGLVPVANKSLTTSPALYTGAKNVTITGKTTANTEVNIAFGNQSENIKSNNNGDFTAEIPFSDLSIGSEVRVYVNNKNMEVLTVQYDTKVIGINNNKIEVLNNEGVPVFNVEFNPTTNKLMAVAYPLDKTYAGAFYGNYLNIKVINPKTGATVYNFTGNKLNDINSFISQINNKPYTINDIIEVSYNPNYVEANVYNGKDSIGNSTGQSEYFKITEKGLVNLNNKFVSINPVAILDGQLVTKTNITGKVTANTKVEVSIDGKNFSGESNSSGDFNIPVTCESGFTTSTNIVVSADGYVPTTVNPTMESNIDLMNSYVNFYNSAGDYGKLLSSIGFNPDTMKFVVNNYADSFGSGSAKYFDLSLYNSNGSEILNSSINDGSTSQLTNAINGKSFNYGDIIGLNYNNSISKPVILNGNNAIGNISGQEEYFEITKAGLVPVNFGQSASTSNVYFNDNNLVINSNLASGQSADTLNASKKLVILNSSNKVVVSVNGAEVNNNSSVVQGVITAADLSKLTTGESYEFALEINNKLYPISLNSKLPSNSKYLLSSNSKNQLTLSVRSTPAVTMSSSADISNYMNSINSTLNKTLNSNSNNVNDIINNAATSNDLTTSEFISTIGLSNLESFFNESTANKNFVNWVLSNQTAMEEFLNGSAPNGTYEEALQVWSNIWNTYSNSQSGFNLKLAIAVALTNAKEVTAWPGKGTVGSQVQRYNIFETLNAEGGMLPIFDTLDVRHIGYVVDTHIANDQIMEMRSIIMENHNGFINANPSAGIHDVAYTINYNETNPHTGASVFGPDFYGPNPTIKDVWYDGGVCGSTSYMGASACQVFGLPATPVGQPGHCAFIYYDGSHAWNIGNNIYGWSESNGKDISGWSKGIATNDNVVNYDLLYEAADNASLAKSNQYLWLAKSNISYNAKMAAINEAIKVQPLNLGAWLEKISIMKSNPKTTVNDYITLSNEIISTFKGYPMPMFDTLLQIRNEILLNGTQAEYNNFVDGITNALDSVTNSNQTATAKEMLGLMSQYSIVKGASSLTMSSINMSNVWNQNLGSITFNNVTKKMNFAKGWGEINPYLNGGEAFNISLESPSGKVIKSVTLTGGQHPENTLYAAFNGTTFEFGDKIVIDYKGSSNIVVNSLKTSTGVQAKYDVKQPTTIYIEQNGLTLINSTDTAKVPNKVIQKPVVNKDDSGTSKVGTGTIKKDPVIKNTDGNKITTKDSKPTTKTDNHSKVVAKPNETSNNSTGKVNVNNNTNKSETTGTNNKTNGKLDSSSHTSSQTTKKVTKVENAPNGTKTTNSTGSNKQEQQPEGSQNTPPAASNGSGTATNNSSGNSGILSGINNAIHNVIQWISSWF